VRQLANKELNQRFGCELTNALAQAYGQTAQSLPLWRPDTHFQQYVEFLDLAREQDHWMPGVIVLLQQLLAFLRLHTATTTVVKFCFSHGHQQRTTIEVHASHGLRHTDQWMRLFAARIERQPVVHEVSRIDLFCDQLHEADLHELDFFDHSSTHQQEWQSLLNLISTRLGNQAIVKSPRNPHNALPESISTAQQKAPAALFLRPTWLIDPPRLLCGGLLRNLRTTLNLRQPERIESHWSSATGIDAPCRDYYIAKTTNHSIWWIFRDRISEQWFLHGIFA
jgi:protein ImuB